MLDIDLGRRISLISILAISVLSTLTNVRQNASVKIYNDKSGNFLVAPKVLLTCEL